MSTTLEALIDAAVAAQEAGDFGLALSKLRSAKIRIAGTPNLTIRTRGMTWRSKDIDEAIELLRQEVSRGVGIQRVGVIWGGPKT